MPLHLYTPVVTPGETGSYRTTLGHLPFKTKERSEDGKIGHENAMPNGDPVLGLLKFVAFV